MTTKAEKEIEEGKIESFEFLQKVNFILKKIRQSDVGMVETVAPDKLGYEKRTIIERVIFPPEGGVLTFFSGSTRPTKGFPYGETVETVDDVKKTLMVLVRSFGVFRNKIKLVLFVLLFRKEVGKMIVALLETFNRRFRTVGQKPEMYCKSVRELYRASRNVISWVDDPILKKVLEDVRDIICMMMEYDDAYRYPFQDNIVELDKEAIKKDVVKELKRIFDIAISKTTIKPTISNEFSEIGADRTNVSNKLRSLRKLLGLLNYIKEAKKILIWFLCELNLSELKLDEDDLYHARLKGGYQWRAQSNEEEKKA